MDKHIGWIGNVAVGISCANLCTHWGIPLWQWATLVVLSNAGIAWHQWWKEKLPSELF